MAFVVLCVRCLFGLFGVLCLVVRLLRLCWVVVSGCGVSFDLM